MPSSKDRFKLYGLLSSPTPDNPNYEQFQQRYEDNYRHNKEFQKESKKIYEKVITIIEAQDKNGAGQLTDREIRFFLREFNGRNFKYGLGSMPASFNILEAFFKYHPSLLLFELLEEEDYLFSMYDFIDFVTSKECTNSIEYLKNSIEDNVIYSFNLLNNLTEISFKTENNLEYIIAGVSIVKQENEVSLFLVAGEKTDLAKQTENLSNLEDATIKRTYIKPADDRKREAVKLLDLDDYWKVFLYLRINLSNKSIETRYIQKDEGNSFSTLTDDYGMFELSIPNKKDLEEYITNQVNELNQYDAIFEVAYKCLHLPEYFDKFDEHLVIEEHPTLLASEENKPSPFKKGKKYSSEHFFKYKDIWTLDKNITPRKTTITNQDDLKLEKSGYWKYLTPGSIGRDRKGNKIHNRTWVEQTLAWYDTSSANQKRDLYVSINPATQNNGYIYLLRNAAHELNIFKIGLTTRTPEERAKELSGTPTPDKFLIINKWFVKDCFVAEKLIHEKLHPFRLNPKREFFRIPLEDAIMHISPIIKSINET